MPIPDQLYDCLIVGGGPGGLTAAIYLCRFRRTVALLDKGHSRLSLIPVSHNYPGFPEGVHGEHLLARLREQLGNYGGAVTEGEVLSLARAEDGHDGFVAETSEGPVRARKVLLATGIADGGMPMEGWHDAVLCGAVRLCPVCDGYDVAGRDVAVVSAAKNAVGHALFIRSFAKRVTLFDRDREAPMTGEERERLCAAQVRHIESPLKATTFNADKSVTLHTDDGEDHRFDIVYPMLGETARSDLATALGAQVADCSELVVDHHQQTTVPGVYAVGDVVRGLNQISVAAGHAAIAATAIHNALPARYA